MSLWMVRGVSKLGEYQNLLLEKGIVAIGWHSMPDLSWASTPQAMRELIRQTYPQATEAKVRNFLGQLFGFAHRLDIDDLVVMPLRSRPHVAIGRVTGPYRCRTDVGDIRHARSVEWVRTDVPRTQLGQDLLYSLGAIMTVCQIRRNDAERRVLAILEGRPDPGLTLSVNVGDEDVNDEATTIRDIEQIARDQIIARLDTSFKGHDFARLVDAVLRAEGFFTELSPAGPDGGVDILAAKGLLGMDGPRLCVQVKSSSKPVDVNVLRTLQGSMSNFKAEQGLLVSMGSFTAAAEREARLSFFSVRLWDADDVVEALLQNYDHLPEELRKELPLKRVWTLVNGEED